MLLGNGKKARMSAKIAPKVAKGAGKAGWKGAKAEARLARRAASPGEPAPLRLAKYGAVALVGSLAGALLDRLSVGNGGDLSVGVGPGGGAGLATRAAPKAARGAGKAAMSGAKSQARLAGRALSPREPASARAAKYAGATLVGIAAGAILGRPSSGQD